MKMGQLEDMQSFVRVVEAGSISKAAEQQSIAKSMVSRKLANLENHLGVTLLTRTTRKITLTDAGREYYQRSLGILDEVAALDQTASCEKLALSGPIHLAAPLSFGLQHLSPAIDQFMALHPDVQLKISFSDSQHRLVEEGIDVALRIANLKDSTLKARRISPIKITMSASPAYIEKHGMPTSPEELKRHQILHYSNLPQTQFTLTDKHGHHHEISYEPHVIANNGDFLNDLAIAGQGIVINPTFISWQAISTGQLHEILPDYSLPDVSAWAVYPNTRFVPLRVRALIDFLAERFGDNPYWDQALQFGTNPR